MTDFRSAAEWRLFTGIPLPEALQEVIAAFRAQFPRQDGLRWTAAENLHITTLFLGPVPGERVENVIQLIRLGLSAVPAFRLDFTGFGFGPKGRDPRMIWAKFEKNEAFRYAANELARLYAQIEPRFQHWKDPLPHVTLARLKEDFDPHGVQFGPAPQGLAIAVKQMTLWSSELRPEGPLYTPLAEFPLRG